MSIFLCLALGAFLFKGYWWFASRDYVWADARWYFLLSAFSIQNLSEFFIYDLSTKSIDPFLFIKVYYLSLLAITCSIFLYVYIKGVLWQKISSIFLSLWAVLLSLLVVFSDLILLGVTYNTGVVVANKGELFGVFLSFLVIGQGLIISALIVNYYKAATLNDKVGRLYYIVAFAPFLLAGLIVSLGMVLGFKINGSGVFPVASSLFLGITIYYRCQDENKKSDPRKFIPRSKESVLLSDLMSNADSVTLGQFNLAENVSNYEKSLFQYYIKQGFINKSELARKLGISRQTLYKKINKYELDDYFT